MCGLVFWCFVAKRARDGGKGKRNEHGEVSRNVGRCYMFVSIGNVLVCSVEYTDVCSGKQNENIVSTLWVV